MISLWTGWLSRHPGVSTVLQPLSGSEVLTLHRLTGPVQLMAQPLYPVPSVCGIRTVINMPLVGAVKHPGLLHSLSSRLTVWGWRVRETKVECKPKETKFAESTHPVLYPWPQLDLGLGLYLWSRL